MNHLGWNDPVEVVVKLAYRRKGERREGEFHGPIYVLGPAPDYKLTHVPRTELVLKDDVLDLTRVPVVGIGGKRKRQSGRAKEFLQQNPSFQGAILLYPGTGNWDLGEGMLFVTSREILGGKSFSGGRPEVQLTNFRWLSDGRYVADRAKMLHGKVLETLQAEIEFDVPMDVLVKQMSDRYAHPRHPLCEKSGEVWSDLYELENRRVMEEGGSARDVKQFITAFLTEQFISLGYKRMAQVPADFIITAEICCPELIARRDTIGTVEVPGFDRRLPKMERTQFGFGDAVRTVAFSIEEFRQLESWPFDKVYPMLIELGDAYHQLDYGLRDAIAAPEAERLTKIQGYFSRRWTEFQRNHNRPKDEPTVNPLESDPPATPAPVVWGFNLLTGTLFTAYAALVHRVVGGKGRILDTGWSICWYDDPSEAAKADAGGRREAESYITARRLEAELTANAPAVPFPAAIPVRPKEIDDYEIPAEKRDEIAAEYQTKVREFVATLEVAPQWSCLSSKLADEVRKAAEYGYDLEKLASRLSEAWAQAEQLRQFRDAGEILVNFGGHFRVMGATGQAQYWVVMPNGTERDSEEVDYRKRYISEGFKLWRLVGRGELAISWFKANTAADHQFVVDKLPVGGCTPTQLEVVSRLEGEIAERWEGQTGMSGNPSPGIGKGW